MCKFAPETDVVVQCTSLGMSGHEGDYEDLSFAALLPATASVADVIFNPERTSLLKKAEERGVDVVFEPINLYVINYINTLDEGTDFVKRVASPRFWLIADTHHMRIHDGDMYEAIVWNRDYIRYVHYSDGNRYYPGGGNIDFTACTKALLDIGYDGWITMECLALKDGKRCARRALEYSRKLEEACRAVMD